MFTTNEGEWDEVFDVIHRATDAVAGYGSRVDHIIKVDIHPGHQHELSSKMQHLEEALTRQTQTLANK